MCMSVPQIAVLAISMSTSLGPTLGSGMSSSQMPGCACCLTSAFMCCSSWGWPARFTGDALSVQHAELVSDAREGFQSLLELLARQRGGHLRTDARLALRHHRIREADDVHPACEQRIRHARG